MARSGRRGHNGRVGEVRYRRWVLDELLDLGIRPRERTTPALIRAHLNDLYTFELRRLRRELVEAERDQGRKQRAAYSERVVALRRRYALLSQPLESWTEAA
jgi:hypothetical protein